MVPVPEMVATNFPLAARATESILPSLRVCDSASWDPVNASNNLILLSFHAAKICRPSLDQASGVLGKIEGGAVLMVMSLSLVRLSKMRIERLELAVAIRSPLGENLTAVI